MACTSVTETFWCFSSCLYHVGLFNSHVVKRGLVGFFPRTHNAVGAFLCVSGQGIVQGCGFVLILCHPPTPTPTLKLFWCIAKGLSSLNLSRLASVAVSLWCSCGLLYLLQAWEHFLSACLHAGHHRRDLSGVTSTFVTSLLYLPNKSGV